MLRNLRLYLFSFFFFSMPAYGAGSFQFFLNLLECPIFWGGFFERPNVLVEEFERPNVLVEELEHRDFHVGENMEEWNALHQELHRRFHTWQAKKRRNEELKQKEMELRLKRAVESKQKCSKPQESKQDFSEYEALTRRLSDLDSRIKKFIWNYLDKQRHKVLDSRWKPYLQDRRYSALSQANTLLEELMSISNEFVILSLDGRITDDKFQETNSKIERLQKHISNCVDNYIPL